MEELVRGFKKFQKCVNKVTDGDIQFTLDIWKPTGEDNEIEKGINVIGGNTMPYLDAELRFDGNGELKFGVHFKKDFKTKYVGQESMHTKECLKAIKTGVGIRVSGLTSRTPQNEDQTICELYPSIRLALSEAGLLKKNEKLPKLGSLLDSRERDQAKAMAKRMKRKKDIRTIYIPESYSGDWRAIPTHVLATKLAKKYGLDWVRIRMSHKRFRNLKEMLLADCTSKVMENVKYFDKGQVKPYKKMCNCSKSTFVGGECAFKEKCRTRDIIYSVVFTPTKMKYLGKTTNTLKHRVFTEHVTDLVKFWTLRKLHDQYQMKNQLKKKEKGKKEKSKIGLSSETDQSQEGISYLAEYVGRQLAPKKSRKVANSSYQDDFDREFGKFRDKDEEKRWE